MLFLISSVQSSTKMASTYAIENKPKKKKFNLGFVFNGVSVPRVSAKI